MTSRLKPDVGSGAEPATIGAIAAEPEPRYKVLFNITRLLSNAQKTAGTDRLVMALLACLPDRTDLRVAIAPHSSDLPARFPGLCFLVVSQDNNEELKPHLDWCDCYLAPLGELYPTVIRPGVGVIGLALDLRHLMVPWLYSHAELESRNRHYSYGINRSNQIVVMSQHERNALSASYDIDRLTVMCLPDPAAQERSVQAAHREPIDRMGIRRKSYLLYRAAPSPQNDHATLIQALSILKNLGRSIGLVLIDDGDAAANLEYLAGKATAYGVADLVTPEKVAPEGGEVDPLIDSIGVVLPDLSGSGSIYLLDAMALGIPILTARTSAAPEICGDAAFYFDLPQNAMAVANDLARFWDDEDGRRAKRELGLQRSLDFLSSGTTDSLVEALSLAVGRGATLPPRTQAALPCYPPLSVLILYHGLDDEDLTWLRAQHDLSAWHRARFGSAADITVALDPDLLADPVIAALFGRVPKLIMCSGSDARALDAAVLDFSDRYDQAEAQLVVRYAGDRLCRYDAERIGLALLALDVHHDADYAVFDPLVRDCRTDAPLDEVAAAIDYEDRRRTGYAVLDTIVRRRAIGGLRNGTSRFLSHFCTTLRRLHVPCA